MKYGVNLICKVCQIEYYDFDISHEEIPENVEMSGDNYYIVCGDCI